MVVAGALGVSLGIEALLYIPKLNLDRGNELYKIAGVQKPLIVGYLPYWLLDKASSDYSDYLTDISYFGLIVNSDGTLVKKNNATEKEPGWNNLDAGAKRATSLLIQSGVEESISTLLNDPVKNADTLMNEIEPILTKYNFKDLTIDIESVKSVEASVSDNYSVFIETIKQRLHNFNNTITLSIDVPVYAYSRSTIYNPKILSSIVDYMVLMTYDYHYRSSYVTGPVAPLSGAGLWWENDVDRAIKQALIFSSPEKIILGIPLYGYEWETQLNTSGAPIIPGSGLTASNKRIETLLTTCQDCLVDREVSSGEKVIKYFDKGTNSWHQIYAGDSQTLQQKINLAKKYRLGGVALWALGYEDSQQLKVLTDYKDFKWTLNE